MDSRPEQKVSLPREYYLHTIPGNLDRNENGKTILDYDSRFESSLQTTAIIGILIGIISLVVLFFQTSLSRESLIQLWPLTIGFGGVGLLALIMRLTLRQWLVLDRTNKEIIFRYSFLFFRGSQVLTKFQDVFGVTIQSVYRKSRYSVWWDYTGVLILKNGRVVPISNPSGQLLPEHFAFYKGLAGILGCKYLEFQEDRKVIVKQKPVHSIEDLSYLSRDDMIKQQRNLNLFVIAVAAILSVLITVGYVFGFLDFAIRIFESLIS